MTEGPISDRGPLIDWTAYGRMHAQRGEIWQARLQMGGPLYDARRLTRITSERGVRLGGGPGDAIERLWLLAWLKADLVRAADEVDEAALLESAGDGLVRVGTDPYGRRLYADARASGHGGGEGRVGGAAKVRMLDGVAPLFHPFRFHVLHWLEGMLRFNVSPLSTLTTAGPESLSKFNERIAGFKDERYSSASFSAELREFNDRVALTVLAEPPYWGKLFDYITWQAEYEPEELGLSDHDYDELTNEERKRRARELFDKRMEEHKEAIRDTFEQMGIDRIEYERRRLCEAADVLESNRALHTLLRVTRGAQSILLEDSLGGAMLTKIAAELLRRAAEEIFDTQLPEEDELGPSLLSPKALTNYLKTLAFGYDRR